MVKYWSGVGLACIAVLLRAAPAAAQSLEEALRKCAAEPNGERRLACYDRTVRTQTAPNPTAKPAASGAATGTPVAGTALPTAAGAVASGTAAATASDSAAAANQFGTRNGPLDARRAATEPQEITAAVTGLERRASGLLVVALDNGQSWVENEPADLSLKIGDTVRIRAAAFGSYMLFASSKRFTHVTRIR